MGTCLLSNFMLSGIGCDLALCFDLLRSDYVLENPEYLPVVVALYETIYLRKMLIIIINPTKPKYCSYCYL